MAIVITDSQNYSDIADAIRGKGVGGVFKPSEMADAIADIPTGGTDYLQYVISCPAFSDRIPDENVVLNMPLCARFVATFSTGFGVNPQQKTITVNSSASVTSVDQMFNYYNGQRTPLERVTLNFSTASCTAFDRAFGSVPNLRRIDGTPLDFSSVAASATTSNNRLFLNANNTNPLTVSFVANRLKGSISLGNVFLTDASMISVANCLTATAKSIQLSTPMKTKCQTIMGTVSQVTEGDATYDFFTADAGGTVTLESFITQTKGWTIA